MNMEMNNGSAHVETMLRAQSYAVVGASANPEKYGFRVFHDLKAFGKPRVYAVNPNADVVDGDRTYTNVSSLPEVPDVVVAVVPPRVTEMLVDELIALGVKSLWMQEGAESEAAITKATGAGIATVHSGPCILVGLRTHFRQIRETVPSP